MHKYKVKWLIHDDEQDFDTVSEAKAAISSSFTQDVMFYDADKYIVAEYYFKPIAIIQQFYVSTQEVSVELDLLCKIYEYIKRQKTIYASKLKEIIDSVERKN